MYIDLTNKVENELYNFEIVSDGDESLFEGRNIDFLDKVTIEGTYQPQKDQVNVKATIFFSIKAECDKCLKATKRDYKIPIEETFNKDSQDPEQYSYVDHKVDLEKMVKEKILLNLEEKILCKDNCKGICPVCGSDLNQVQCACQTTDEKNPFAILKSIVGGAKNGSTKK